MKTRIDIAAPLLKEARALARAEGSTLGSLVEEGLRKVMAARAARPPFRLRRASFRGIGLQADLEGAGWERLRERAYRGRGA
jgi:hypothetical protein